jgi:hypothetical protein
MENPFEIILERLTNIERLLSEIKRSEKPVEKSDRCGIEEARIILGTPDKPASKAKVYQLTHLKKIQFNHFGRALVFSRKELLAYREEYTLPPFSRVDEMNNLLIKSAQKHLRASQK